MLSLSGLVYACGDNTTGQIGDSSRNQAVEMKLVEEVSHIPMRFVAAGSFSASISEESKSLFLWGSGIFGEFLTPHRVKKIKEEVESVSVGSSFGVALTAHGLVYSWGENNVAQIGTGEQTAKATPQLMTYLDSKRVTQVSCGTNFTVALG